MTSNDNILITGSTGQIGSELTIELRNIFGASHVIASDISEPSEEIRGSGPFEYLDVLDIKGLGSMIDKYKISQIYHLAAILSAVGEAKPKLAWAVNMDGLLNILNISHEKKLHKIFCPSSIAVFGSTTPNENTPQFTITEPSTVYGISKIAGERWGEYYFNKYGLDVRSLRYPGLLSYKTAPGGGTTDYAVEIFHEAIQHGTYKCFLNEGTILPMMYMPDAIRGTIEMMEANASLIKIRSSYNMAAFSFAPEQIAAELKKYIPDFKITYHPDFRQAVAESWPKTIDDSRARKDWGWKHNYNLASMTKDMYTNIKNQVISNV